MLSFIELHRKLIQNCVKEENSTERELNYTRVRWKLIQTQLKDISSESESKHEPDLPSESGEEGRIPFDT